MIYNSIIDYIRNAENNRNPSVANSLLLSEPGMKELPDVDVNDNGKILGVVNGEWNKVSVGSGGGVTVLTRDINGALNMTWAEINELPFAVLRVEDENGVIWYALNETLNDGLGNYSVRFVGMDDQYITDSADGYPTKTIK